MAIARVGRLLVMVVMLLDAARAAEGPADPTRIRVAASKGLIIPQAKGGGFQRTFRFTAIPGESSHWIMQVLEVRGTVLDGKGTSTPVSLDVIEYYRVGSSGRAIQADSHYSQFREHCGGDLTISSTLTYGTLTSFKRGDTIVSKSFILRSARDAAGDFVTMRTSKGKVIPDERGKRVNFRRDAGSIPTHYTYRVQWDARPGVGSRTRPSGVMEVGTWHMEAPKQTGKTVAIARPRPIPRIKPTR